MEFITRNITALVEKSGYSDNSQASLNSDGCLILRNYSKWDKSKDEIIIFTRQETSAIFRLMQWLPKSNDLPF